MPSKAEISIHVHSRSDYSASPGSPQWSKHSRCIAALHSTSLIAAAETFDAVFYEHCTEIAIETPTAVSPRCLLLVHASIAINAF